MKYILSIIAVLLVSFPFFTNTNIAVAWIFSNSTSEIPYCNNWECWLEEWVNAIKNIDGIETKRSASEYIQAVVKYVLWFLALIATIMIIYAWFNLLTWIGDEEKAKKTKSIIIYAIIWLIIIFLAWPIITFVLKVLNVE
jgi:hypothetical protein